jgi:Zn-finger nucleic acid-binding protein
MKCPKCAASSLETTKVADTEVDRCASCGGVWFDEHELRALLDEGPRDLKPLAGGSDRGHGARRGRCPRDAEELLPVHSARNPDVVVDTCPTCRGIWLDAGELDRLREGRPEA